MCWRCHLPELPDVATAWRKETKLESGQVVGYIQPPSFTPPILDPNDPEGYVDASGVWEIVYGYEGGPYRRFVRPCRWNMAPGDVKAMDEAVRAARG